MTLSSVKRHPESPLDDILELTGTPDELTADNDDNYFDVVAGFTVKSVKPGGAHDSHSAHVIELADDMGQRSIGRLIVRDDVPFYKEECLTWERQFNTPELATAFLTNWEARADVYTTVQDFAFEEASFELAAATVSSKFGISIEKVEEDAGGGWPSIRMTGLRANLMKALTEAWGYVDDGWAAGEMKRLG